MNENITIDLREYLKILVGKLWLIIVICLVFSAGAAVFSWLVLDKVYEASTTIYVIGKQGENQNAIMYNDVLTGQFLVKDYRELIKQRLITDQVIDELSLRSELSSSQLAAKIGVSLKNDTRILEIRVQDVKPERAAKLANKVAEVFSKKVVDIMKVENVKLLDNATIPLNPIKPNEKMNVLIAFFIGLMVSVGIIFLMEYLDNTIKSPEDVQKHLGIPVIGNIPNYQKD